MTWLHTTRRCPKCQEQGFDVIESRKTGGAIRRRLGCSSCGHRETVFEIKQVDYDRYKENERIITKLRDALEVSGEESLSKTRASRASCLMCRFMSGRGCSFDFPEAGDEFAAECSQYDPVQNG